MNIPLNRNTSLAITYGEDFSVERKGNKPTLIEPYISTKAGTEDIMKGISSRFQAGRLQYFSTEVVVSGSVGNQVVNKERGFENMLNHQA